MTQAIALAAETAQWLTGLSEADLVAQFGSTTVDRGRSYYRGDRLRSILTSDRGQTLIANVIGSRGRSYATIVRTTPGPDNGFTWLSRCSCPMVSDCKHVVAVLLYARTAAVAMRPVQPRWEKLLESLLGEQAVEDGAPLALHIGVHQARQYRWNTGQQLPTLLRARPLTPGKRSGWIKSGVTWNDLSSGYGRVSVRPTHRTLFKEFFALSGTPVYGPPDGLIGLDEVGTSLWRWLRDAQAADVALLTGDRNRPVQVDPEPARVVLTAQSDDGDALIDPQVLRGDTVVDADDTIWIGNPVAGFATGAKSGELRLTALDRVLDPAVARLLRHGAIRIPGTDLQRFVSGYLPRLAARVEVRSDSVDLAPPTITGPLLGVHLQPLPDHRTRVAFSWVYEVNGDPVRLSVVGAAPAGAPTRNPAAERELIAQLDYLRAVPELLVHTVRGLMVPAEVVLRGMQTIVLHDRVLPELITDDRVRVSVDGPLPDYRQAESDPLISVSATDSDDPGRTDWFDLAVTVTVDGETVPFTPLFTALAAGSDHLVLESGTWFSLDRPELHALRRLIDEARALQEPDSPGLQLTRLHAGLWEELVELGVVAEQSARWSSSVSALLELESIPTPAQPDGLQATLRSYQLRGYQWLTMLWDNGIGGILADDMGLGKTVQMLALAARAAQRGDLRDPILIVCPTSVIGTWAEQADRFTPDLRVGTVTETASRRGVALAEIAANVDLVVTSYTLLRIEEAEYHALHWSGVVLDEAQAVKNYRAKTYQSVRRVPAPFRLAITGTPLENSLMDLWALLSIVAPGLYPDPVRFTDEYRRPIESGQEPERLIRLRRRIRPLMLRRTKREVAPELPPKQEQVLHVDLNPAHRRVYAKHLQRERQRVLGMLDDVQRNRIAIFRALTMLRQLSLAPSLVDAEYAAVASSKIDVLAQHLQEVVAEGHRALIFSQFTGFLRLVRNRLETLGIDYCYLDGRTRDRPARIAQFREGDAPLFLISLKAGGFGLTLTEADYVFILDPWWNPAAEEQAIDRTHRIGQDKTVMVYRLVASDTIEEKVVALQERKRQLFRDVVEAEGLMGAPLTPDDIRALLA